MAVVCGHGELANRMAEALGIPKRCRAFSLHVSVDEVIRVTCECLADDGQLQHFVRELESINEQYHWTQRPVPPTQSEIHEVIEAAKTARSAEV